VPEKKSKTDVTARNKSGRATNRDCTHCGLRIMNDRELATVMDPQRRNKTYYRRDCFQRLLSPERELVRDGTGVCPLATRTS
jgi:hypothetical protein